MLTVLHHLRSSQVVGAGDGAGVIMSSIGTGVGFLVGLFVGLCEGLGVIGESDGIVVEHTSM